jgi:hypothetical protein
MVPPAHVVNERGAPAGQVRDEVSIKTLEAEFGKIPGMKHLTSGRK